jgi:hypothetical protein
MVDEAIDDGSGHDLVAEDSRAGGSRTRAARDLGLSRQGLLKVLERLGLAKPCSHSGLEPNAIKT